MKYGKVVWIVTVTLSAIVPIVLMLFYAKGYNDGRNDLRQQAIDAGVGGWKLDENNDKVWYFK